jgi:hypothetical protein
MQTVHLIYPHAAQIATPHAIALKLAARLRPRYRTLHYDLNYPKAIVPVPGDILLGHPDAAAWTVFRRSMNDPRWGRKIGMAPFMPGDLGQSAYLHRFIPACDLFLAITGQHWFRAIPSTPFRHFLPKLVHLDLAVDRGDFPFVKRSWNPPGKRRFVYIGHDAGYKNLPYLQDLASRSPGCDFTWIGTDRSRYPNLRCGGRRDFSDEENRRFIAGFDFMVTVGRADANPTTILEAMSWGLIPVCTPESGYDREEGVINVPLDDAGAAAEIIARLQSMPEERLQELQRINQSRLEGHYHWDRFAEVVIGAIASHDRPSIGEVPREIRRQLLLAEMRAHSAPWRYHHLRRAVLRRFFGKGNGHNCGAPDACAGAAKKA